MNDRKKKTIFIYVFLYCIFFGVVFSPFWVKSKSFLWISDGLTQTYPELEYTREYIRRLVHGVFVDHQWNMNYWELSLGYGQDVFGNAFNFRPINWLYALFPENSIEAYLIFRAFILLFLAGLAYLLFAWKHVNHEYKISALLISTFIYLFNGFTLFYAPRHTFFMEMMIYLPLMLYGVDGTYEKGWSKCFIFTTAMAGLSYFFFLYIVTIPACVYALYIFLKGNKEWQRLGKILFTFVCEYLLGVGISAISLIPSIYRSFYSGRGDNNHLEKIMLYGKDYYMTFIKSFICMDELGNSGYIGISVLGLIAIFLVLFSLRQKKESPKYLLLLFLSGSTFFIPLLSMLYNGFAGVTQRWIFIFVFCVAITFAQYYPGFFTNNGIMLKTCFGVLTYWGAYYLICNLTNSKMCISSIWLSVYALIIIICVCVQFSERKVAVFTCLLIAFFGIEMTQKSYEFYSDSYLNTFAKSGSVAAMADDNPSDVLKQIKDDSIYRVDVSFPNLSQKYHQNNYGFRNSINGVSNYYSFSNKVIGDYSLDLGNSQQNVRFLICDFDQRTGLDLLAGVKYLCTTDESNHKIPYGYQYIGSDSKTYSNGKKVNEHLYVNKYALPLMYTYSSYIPQLEYMKYAPNEKEQAMLQGVVLTEDMGLEKLAVKFDYEQILKTEDIIQEIKKQGKSDVEIIDDNTINILKKNISIILPVKTNDMCEYYLRIQDGNYEAANYKNDPEWKANNTSVISIQDRNVKDVCTLTNSSYKYYVGNRDFLLNLGYCTLEEPLVLTFGQEGKYSFSGLDLIKQSMDNYDKYVADLKKCAVNNICIKDNNISAEVNADTDRCLCIAIPYSDGWSASLNGEKIKIYHANGMYMGIRLQKGINRLELTYVTPGLYVGAIITGVSLLIVVIGMFITNRFKRGWNAK